MIYALYVLIGFLSGIVSGMGIGGGVILIPALTLLLGFEQKTAQSVNLIYFIPTALIALAIHKKSGNLDKGAAFKLTAGGILGAVAGALTAISLEQEMLKKGFGIFLLILGVWEICKKKENENGTGRISEN